jgi:hypothetical protein
MAAPHPAGAILQANRIGTAHFVAIDGRLVGLHLRTASLFLVSLVQEPLQVALGSFRLSHLAQCTNSAVGHLPSLCEAFIHSFEDYNANEPRVELVYPESTKLDDVERRDEDPTGLGAANALLEHQLTKATGRSDSATPSLNRRTSKAPEQRRSVRGPDAAAAAAANGEEDTRPDLPTVKVTFPLFGVDHIVTLQLNACPETAQDPFVFNVLMDLYRFGLKEKMKAKKNNPGASQKSRQQSPRTRGDSPNQDGEGGKKSDSPRDGNSSALNGGEGGAIGGGSKTTDPVAEGATPEKKADPLVPILIIEGTAASGQPLLDPHPPQPPQPGSGLAANQDGSPRRPPLPPSAPGRRQPHRNQTTGAITVPSPRLTLDLDKLHGDRMWKQKFGIRDQWRPCNTLRPECLQSNSVFAEAAPEGESSARPATARVAGRSPNPNSQISAQTARLTRFQLECELLQAKALLQELLEHRSVTAEWERSAEKNPGPSNDGSSAAAGKPSTQNDAASQLASQGPPFVKPALPPKPHQSAEKSKKHIGENRTSPLPAPEKSLQPDSTTTRLNSQSPHMASRYGAPPIPGVSPSATPAASSSKLPAGKFAEVPKDKRKLPKVNFVFSG